MLLTIKTQACIGIKNMYRTTLRFIGLTVPFYQLSRYVDETPNETLLTATENT